MSAEIATEGILRVRRPNRDYLLRVRAGEFDYDTLVALAEEKLAEVRQVFEKSPLADEPDRDAVNAVLREIRVGFLHIRTAHPAEKVGGPRPTRPTSPCSLLPLL